MRHFSPLDTANRAAVSFRNALINPARRERSVLVALAFYVLLWTIYGTVAKGSQGLHADMTEVIAWSRDLSLGYLKHPPLAAWIARLWFSVFPVTEPSYYLLAMLMPATALWFAWRLSADYLDIEKRVIGLAMLTLISFFNFHALKFNVNTVLMPVWAATTFWFLRSYETRSRVYAALAGAGAAACMLGKYWSVYLLAGLFVAALIDARRADYFRSPAPWITAAVGLAVLTPHLVWLVQNGFEPFSYALTVHGERPLIAIVKGVAGYLAGSIGYVAIPLIVVMLAAWPSRATIADMIWPAGVERRLVAASFWGPFLLPVIGALVSATEITSLWSMPCWALLPVLLLSPEAVRLTAADTRRVLVAAIVVPLIMLIAAPLIAIQVHRSGPAPAAAHARLLAVQIESAWHEATPKPLRFVGGDAEIAYDVIAYAADRPRALPDMLPPGEAELAQTGMVLVCFSEDLACFHSAQARAPSARRTESEIVRDYLGMSGKPQRYTIVIVPPRG
jgi:4-amino-4-deoxy-L-arabinose transferase-like glycosyltransferase